MRASTAGRQARDYLFSSCSLQIPRTEIPQMPSENSQGFHSRYKGLHLHRKKKILRSTHWKKMKKSTKTPSHWVKAASPLSSSLGGSAGQGACEDAARPSSEAAGPCREAVGSCRKLSDRGKTFLQVCWLPLCSPDRPTQTTAHPCSQAWERVQRFDSKYISLAM